MGDGSCDPEENADFYEPEEEVGILGVRGKTEGLDHEAYVDRWIKSWLGITQCEAEYRDDARFAEQVDAWRRILIRLSVVLDHEGMSRYFADRVFRGMTSSFGWTNDDGVQVKVRIETVKPDSRPDEVQTENPPSYRLPDLDAT